MPGSFTPFITLTAPALSNNNRVASTAYVDSAVSTSYNYLKPYFGDTPPNPSLGYAYWFDTSGGQLYVYYQSAWITAATFSGGNGYVTSTGGTLINGTIDGTVIGGSYPTLANFTDVTATSINGGSITGFKNRIINGDFRIDQRNNNNLVVPTSSTYISDRWAVAISQASKLSFTSSLNIGSVGSVGPGNTGLTLTSAQACTTNNVYTSSASDYFQLYQNIEGYSVADFKIGTSLAQPFVVSFYAYCTFPGTYCVRLLAGTTNTYSYVRTFTLLANTWTFFSFMIPALTSGPVGQSTTTGSGLQIGFDLGSGSNFETTTVGSWLAGNYTATPNSVNLISNSGASLFITGVQIEKGTIITAFERRPRPIELLLCQRYFWTGSVYGIASRMGNDPNGSLRGVYTIPVAMATTPTYTIPVNLGSADGDPTNSGSNSSYYYPSLINSITRQTINGFEISGYLPSGVSSVANIPVCTMLTVQASAEI